MLVLIMIEKELVSLFKKKKKNMFAFKRLFHRKVSFVYFSTGCRQTFALSINIHMLPPIGFFSGKLFYQGVMPVLQFMVEDEFFCMKMFSLRAENRVLAPGMGRV